MLVSQNDIIEWYEKKTSSIIRKYGPGPRVYFHTGWIEPELTPSSDIECLRLQLVESQEKFMSKAIQLWNQDAHLDGVILDVGCGLGGSSIYLAQRFGSKVYALTNVPGHIRYVKAFASQAGVTDRVIPVLGDAHKIPREQVFDIAMAIESSCYLNREAWFKHLSRRIKREGHLLIADCFAINESVCEPFDAYWLTNIGTLNEYLRAAEAAGYSHVGFVDITRQTQRFWEFSVLHSKMVLEDMNKGDPETERLCRSIKWQTKLASFWRNSDILCALLSFWNNNRRSFN